MHSEFTIADALDRSFLQSVFSQAVYQCRADGCAFYVRDPDRDTVALLGTHNLTRVPWDDELPQRVIRLGKVFGETCSGHCVLLAAPLRWQNAWRGVLVVTDDDMNRRFSERDVTLLKSLADMTAALAQQNQRLARMTTQFRTLHAIDVALSSSLDLGHILNLIIEKAVALVGAEHGSLRQLDKASGNLILKAWYGTGWTRQKRNHPLKMGQGIVRWVAENRRPYLCPDVRKDPIYLKLFEDMRSAVAVPLQYGQEEPSKPDAFLGVLFLESSIPAAFDKQDVELLEALAQVAVIAIQNATRHNKLLKEQERRLAAEKWAVMGQAATALAHRINNLMGVVPVSAKEIARSLVHTSLAPSEREWIDANLSRIRRNAEFVLKLSDALFRPFTASGPPEPLAVNRLLNDALESADLPGEIQVITRLQSDLPPVNCGLLLLDVFLELITNAQKAMNGRPVKQLRITSELEQKPEGNRIKVIISDSGKGIEKDRMAHLWSMFHQTKDGLGFGLWWLRTFIERQGGTIQCQSRPDHGATFIIRLPVEPRRTVPEPGTENAPNPKGSRKNNFTFYPPIHPVWRR